MTLEIAVIIGMRYMAKKQRNNIKKYEEKQKKIEKKRDTGSNCLHINLLHNTSTNGEPKFFPLRETHFYYHRHMTKKQRKNIKKYEEKQKKVEK